MKATLKGRTSASGLWGTPVGRGLMYSTYLLRRTRSGNPICFRARTETAEFYGWSKHFESYLEGYWRDPATGTEYIKGPVLSQKKPVFGIPLVISRPSPRSERGKTWQNTIRVTGEATIPDIAQIAAKTEVEWNWLETPCGERRSREEWLSIHETWTQ